MNNELIETLYNQLDAKDKIINKQALELSQLKEQKKEAKKYIKTTLKFVRFEKDFEKEKILLNLLEILGDKE